MRGSVVVHGGISVQMLDLRGPRAFEHLMAVEREAARIYLNQPLFVPGLLQVEGYAVEMISRVTGMKDGDPELADRVRIRMHRADMFQQRLRGATPPHLWVVIDESTLSRAVGDRAVRREQLAHLATMSLMETVHLSIIPLGQGAYPGLGGSFEVHEMASGESCLFFEGAYQDEMVGSKPDLAKRHREAVQAMTSSAVSDGEARALLGRISGTL